MDGDDVERVRQEFAGGEARELRLATGHTIEDCGAAIGVSGLTWWRYESAKQPIPARRAEAVARFLERLRAGERMETGRSADAIPALPLGDGPGDDVITERARREADTLAAAESFMNLKPLDLAAAAKDWDSDRMREMRRAVRRVLRKRINALGIDPPKKE